MPSNFFRILRGSTWAAALALLAIPIAAHAAVEIDPGDTASDLAADGGNILEQCATTATENCQVGISVLSNEVGARVDADFGGAGAASAELFTDFSISGYSEAVLLGSFVSGQVDVTGLLLALANDAMASVDVSLHVMDMTAGVLVGAQTVVSETVVNGQLPVSNNSAVVIPVALTRGHDYRISLIIAADAVGGDLLGAESDFTDTASWTGLSVTAGQDPFGAIDDLADRVTDVESDVARLIPVVRKLVEDLDLLEALVARIANALRDLQQTVAELREDFDNHTHAYLTGKGKGHNKVVATTTSPSDGSVAPVATPPGNSGDAPGNSGDAPGNSGDAPGNSGDADSGESPASCSGRDRRHGRC
jgi:hypothetical protein